MKKLFLLALCPMLALMSCSKDSVDNGSESATTGEYQVRLRINIPSTSTKAAPGETFSSGEGVEYNINYDNSYLVFYSEEKMELVQYKLSSNNTEWTNATTDENITKVGTVKFKSNVKPKYVVCLLNRPNILDNDLSIAGLNKFITKPNGSSSAAMDNYGRNIFDFAPLPMSINGFYMTNSTYYTEQSGNRTIMQEIELADNQVAEVTEDNDANPVPVDIYVERVVAKVTVEDAIENHTIINGDKTINIELLGWTLNATNRSFAQLKKIDPNTDDFNKFSPLSNINWNSTDNHRSYWAVDNNYSSIDNVRYPTNSMFVGTILPNDEDLYLNYFSLNETNTPFTPGDNVTNNMYCFENTVAYDKDIKKRMNAITHIIVKAKYTALDVEPVPPTPPTPPEWDHAPSINSTKAVSIDTRIVCGDGDVFRLEGSKILYSYYELRNEIFDKLQKLLGSEIPLDINSIEIVRNTNDYCDRADVKPVISYSAGTAEFGEYADRMKNLNDLLFPGTQLWVYPQGICYYVVPIYQYRNSSTETPDDYYGVVRNHWYKVQLTDIIDFGEPADPDKPIIPEPNDEKSYKIESKVKVLSWSVVDQSAVLNR